MTGNPDLDRLVDHLQAKGDPCIVAHEGSADEVVATMLAAGWTLSDEVEYVSGKRIRTLVAPS